MLTEWKYYFYDSSSKEILEYLIELKEKGEFLGATFLRAYTHTCFSEAQCERIDNLIQDNWPKSNFQKMSYYRGDLFDVDFGIKTFKQPLVQWCPSPIFSYKTKKIIPPEEPWGYSMEGDILLNSSLRNVVAKYIHGLNVKDVNIHSVFDSYQIDNINLLKPLVNAADNKPLSIDCSEVPKLDIFSLSNGAIVCSARFAILLKKDWDGMIHNKFQPIECKNVPKSMLKENFSKIPMAKTSDISKDIQSIEKHFKIKFPHEYANWLFSEAGRLPVGWLSPIGGIKSELAKYIQQEHEWADPTLSTDLIPVFSYGDGNSICIKKGTNKFVDWNHENGKIDEIEMPNGFVHWLESETG